MADPEFKPLVRRTYASDVVRTIKDMILDGRLTPGQRLPPERTVSEALGVSRPTVREAIRSLQAMNILESRHGSGTYVASLDVEELLGPLQFVLALAEGGLAHLFEVRLLLEPGAAALAAERATPEDVTALRACTARAEAAGGEPELLLELDTELHDLIVRAARNPLLEHLHAAMSALGRQSRRYTTGLPGVLDRTLIDHVVIIDAIAAGEPLAAREAMTAHIARVRDIALAPAAAGGAAD